LSGVLKVMKNLDSI